MELQAYENKLEILQAKLGELPQMECPLEHHFFDGTYEREITMPKGSFVIGKKHRTRHPNKIIKGHCLVVIDGVVTELKAPTTFVSEAGCKKVVFNLEETVWITTHDNPTGETDPDKLVELLTIKEPKIKYNGPLIKQERL